MRSEFVDRIVYSRLFGHWVLSPIATRGYQRFRETGVTPSAAYRAVRKLYGNADATLFEGLIERTLGESPPSATEPRSGVAVGEMESVLSDLRRDGYVVLNTRVPDEVCDELESVARAASCTLVGSAKGSPDRRVFDETAPIATRYDIDEQDIVQCHAAQRLIADESLFSVAERYLGATPVQDLVAMWWSTAVGEPASSAPAAQEFHFDLDRLSFLKVFVLLTDVDAGNGPHVFVRGTHREKPAEFRRDGRHGDDRVLPAFGDAVTTIAGRRGTVFLADTKGLHKGQRLQAGHRLMFQTEYATSLFGNSFGRPTVHSPAREFLTARERHSRSFERFIVPSDPSTGLPAE